MDFYIAAPPLGSDAQPGTESAPLATIPAVNALDLAAGDRIFFRGGDVFEGSLEFDSTTAGTAENPIVIGSYGEGRATIASDDETALFLYNTAGFEIRDLVIVGLGRTSNPNDGVSIYSDLPGGVKLPYLRIERVEISGFGGVGLAIGSWAGSSGFRDIRIDEVRIHDCRDGLLTYAEDATPNAAPNYGLETITVTDSLFENNPGQAGVTRPTGSGLVLGGVDGGLVERCIARNNGAEHTFIAGPVGIWTYNSRAVILQHCESYGNRTSGGDGVGFDLDGGVTDSVIQYCYSHDNDGAGYLLAVFADSGPTSNNTLRYNISVNDGRLGRQGAFFFWGATASDPVEDAWVHNNLIYLDASAVIAGTPIALQFYRVDFDGLNVVNNTIITRGASAYAVFADAAVLPITSVWMRGNSYWAEEGGLRFRFNGSTHQSLAAFRFTGQERSGSVDLGFDGDPRLERPGGPAITLGTSERLAAAADLLTGWRLQPESPLIDGGLDLVGLGGPAPGSLDFFGSSPVPTGPVVDVGPHESRPPLVLWRERFFSPVELGDNGLAASVWGPQADPDDDGQANLLEYSLNSNPRLSGEESGLKIQRQTGGRLGLTFRRLRRDVIHTVLAGDNLTGWGVLAVDPGQIGELVTVIDDAPLNSPRRFSEIAAPTSLSAELAAERLSGDSGKHKVCGRKDCVVVGVIYFHPMTLFQLLLGAAAAAAAVGIFSVRAAELPELPPQGEPVRVVRVLGEPDPYAKLKPDVESIGTYPVMPGTQRDLTDDQKSQLGEEIRKSASYSAGKLRCGFVPGMAVRLEGEDGTVDALVCFGCSEVKFVSDSGVALGDKQVMSAELRAALLAVAHAVWPDDAAIQGIVE